MAHGKKKKIEESVSGDIKKDMIKEDMINEAMINEVLNHLDSELQKGVVRMSVTMDDGAKEEKVVSHKCCNSYGRPANETVGLLDMYTDRNAGKPDREK